MIIKILNKSERKMNRRILYVLLPLIVILQLIASNFWLTVPKTFYDSINGEIVKINIKPPHIEFKDKDGILSYFDFPSASLIGDEIASNYIPKSMVGCSGEIKYFNSTIKYIGRDKIWSIKCGDFELKNQNILIKFNESRKFKNFLYCVFGVLGVLVVYLGSNYFYNKNDK